MPYQGYLEVLYTSLKSIFLSKSLIQHYSRTPWKKVGTGTPQAIDPTFMKCPGLEKS